MNVPLIHLSSNLPNYRQEYHFGRTACFSPRHQEFHYRALRHKSPLYSIGSGNTLCEISTQCCLSYTIYYPSSIQNGCFKDVASTNKFPQLCRGQSTQFPDFITVIWRTFQEMRQLRYLFKEQCEFKRYKCNKCQSKFGAKQIRRQEFQFTKLAWWVCYFAVTNNNFSFRAYLFESSVAATSLFNLGIYD